MSSASIDRQSPRTLPDASRSGRLTGFTPSIDPLRVLRRHWLWIALSAVFGAVLGTASFFVFGKVYQLYSAQVMFEVMPGLANSKDMGNVDTTTDELIFRIAQTETYMLTSRVVLEAAVKKPEIKQTEW
ncbi:MAG TPA: hypothetical protein VG711_01240, partial [Phycisphaerales bacterium]|nr:hypothetical protein [Phycisphaerales bacterium]